MARLDGDLPMISLDPDRSNPSVGSVSYNASNRAVYVEGSDAYNDRVNITIDTLGTSSLSDDMVSISIRNLGVPVTGRYNLSAVDRLFVRVYGGNDIVENQTIVKMTAYGGLGNDLLVGGFGDDALAGGGDNDYIDGRRGDDTLWGEAGVDALFGDDGLDLILGGADDDYLFGGNSDDTLYGELGNDRMYGGAGVDGLTDSSGVNKFYTDYGPTVTVALSGYQGYDWFDRNLKDPDLRSLARLQYGVFGLDRADMFSTYAAVSSDNHVNVNEFADLKMLASTRLAMTSDLRFFVGKIANGDRANQTYKGAALGNLAAGSSGEHLNKLVDKWLRGGDLPDSGGRAYRFISGSLFVNGPTHADVDQGFVGDCYFLAALGAVADSRPSTINNMFIDNGDGTFSVRFFKSGVAQYVTVNRFLPVNDQGQAVFAGWGNNNHHSGNFSTDPTNELWVALAEKAYVQLNASGWIGQDGTNRYIGIESGTTANAFAQITSSSASNYYPALDEYNLMKSQTIALFNGGAALTFSSKDSGTFSYVVSNHAYILTGYDSSTDKFQFYNPWGYRSDATHPEVIELTWSQILGNFSKVTTV